MRTMTNLARAVVYAKRALSKCGCSRSERSLPLRLEAKALLICRWSVRALDVLQNGRATWKLELGQSDDVH